MLVSVKIDCNFRCNYRYYTLFALFYFENSWILLDKKSECLILWRFFCLKPPISLKIYFIWNFRYICNILEFSQYLPVFYDILIVVLEWLFLKIVRISHYVIWFSYWPRKLRGTVIQRNPASEKKNKHLLRNVSFEASYL